RGSDHDAVEARGGGVVRPVAQLAGGRLGGGGGGPGGGGGGGGGGGAPPPPPRGAGLATMEDTWMGIAGGLLERKFPDFSAPIRQALDDCTPLERQRLLQVARSYGRTGSIKETSEELFCHRNTVVNRLHSLHEVIGLDLTVPAQAARALIALSRYSDVAE
ncbi:DNA-binding CsgD family transcriptional regulator, partial [Arthrobacter sp. MP_M7]|nr:DNA-binding CsgD family transcriptional regulator [Arthrobacter sp. MP_M7]